MTEKFGFPQGLRLISNEPIHGDWVFGSEARMAEEVICTMAKFAKDCCCLLSPAFDLNNHIAALALEWDCPVGKVQDVNSAFMCPCEKAKLEIREDGHTSCGVFITEQYLKQNRCADQVSTSKRKTKALFMRPHNAVYKVEVINKVSRLPIALETVIGDEEQSRLNGFIENRNDIPPADATSRQMLREGIEEVLSTLSTREQRVIKLRFGLEDGRRQTLEEVSKEFNVTGECVRQIEAKALRRLRHPSRSSRLRDYLD